MLTSLALETRFRRFRVSGSMRTEIWIRGSSSLRKPLVQSVGKCVEVVLVHAGSVGLSLRRLSRRLTNYVSSSAWTAVQAWIAELESVTTEAR